MNNLCITNYAMIFMFIIIIYLIINQKNISRNKENFALGPEDLTIVRSEINRIYDMDVESIRNLGAISKSLLTGTNTFVASTGTPGNTTIPVDATIFKSGITFDNSTWDKTYNSNGKGHSVGYIVSDNNVFKKLMIVGDNTAGGVRSVGIWDELMVHGNAGVTSNLQIDGNLTVNGNIVFNKLDNPIGIDQTWQQTLHPTDTYMQQDSNGLMTTKTIGTIYTNTSGRPIQVCITIRMNSMQYGGGYSNDVIMESTANFVINNEVISTRMEYDGETDTYIGFNIIVPNGATYSVTDTSIYGVVNVWGIFRDVPRKSPNWTYKPDYWYRNINNPSYNYVDMKEKEKGVNLVSWYELR